MERKLYVDGGEKVLTFVNVQDVEPILDLNKAERADGVQHSDWGRRTHRIPNVVMLEWYYAEIHKGNIGLQMYSEEFDKIVARKLTDPDWAHLKVDKPKLQAGWSAGSL